MADRACRVRVAGRVQGVFFRAWTRDQAHELSVAGWVRNAGDGSVEAHLEGERGAVDKLIDRMRQGPPSAMVEDLQVEDVSAKGFDGFEVRH